MRHDDRDPEAENEGRLLLIAACLVAVALLWMGAGQ